MRQRAWWSVALLVVVAGCTPLFLPPVPGNTLVPTPVWRVNSDSALAWNGAQLELRIRFSEIPQATWVAVQWFGATNGERASASYWVEPTDLERTFQWLLPDDVRASAGAWRAIVSVDSLLLRQFNATVP